MATGGPSGALDLWARSSFVYPFQWPAYLPLLALAVQAGQAAEAVDCARALLAPTQQLLPEALTETLAAAVELFERGQTQAALARLRQAVAVAKAGHYL